MIQLLPYQIPHVDRNASQLAQDGIALNVSDTGTGKTVMALNTAGRLQLDPWVICPKHLRPSWERAFGWNRDENPTLNHYQEFTSKKDPVGGLYDGRRFDFDLGQTAGKILIFDEAHYMFGNRTKASALLIAAKRQRIPTLLLTATPPISPLKYRALGYALGFHGLTDFENWAMEYGATTNRGGLHFDKDECNYFSALLLTQLENHATRARKGDIGDIKADVYRIPAEPTNRGQLENSFEELKEFCRRNSGDDRALGMRVKLLQLIEAGLLRHIKEEVDLSLSHEKGTVALLNYRESINTLADMIPQHTRMGVIHGDVDQEHRQWLVDEFQANRIDLLICQTECVATGLDMHDLHFKPRRFIVSPGDNAISLSQLIGRGARVGSKSCPEYRLAEVHRFDFDTQRVESLMDKLMAIEASKNFNPAPLGLS